MTYFIRSLLDILDPDVAERRMGAMDAHRQRLQEEFDAKAARFAEELKKVCSYNCFIH